MSRTRSQRLVAVAIVAASLGLTASPASACSCAPGPDAEHFQRADAVFVAAMPPLADSDPPDDALDETEPDPESGGIVLVVGFLLVGAGAAVVAARLAKKSRAE